MRILCLVKLLAELESGGLWELVGHSRGHAGRGSPAEGGAWPGHGAEGSAGSRGGPAWFGVAAGEEVGPGSQRRPETAAGSEAGVTVLSAR